MKKEDPALTISNPRLLAAIYFGLLSVVGTILIDAFLTLLGIEEIVPLFQAILIGMIVAAATGALFGERIVHCEKPYFVITFGLGFVMVLASIPFFALGLTLFMTGENAPLFTITGTKSFLQAFLMVLAYSYALFGIPLAIGSGLAAMYLRGQLVYDILHIDRRSSQRLPHFVAAKSKTRAHKKA